jgi:MFS family permease
MISAIPAECQGLTNLKVPPFFLPLYASSLHLASSAGAGLVAGFNFSSAVGRLFSGLLCDLIGPLNSLFLALITSAVSMLVLWPVSTSLGPLIAFVVINGAANGGFFATIPTVASSVFGSARVSVAMGMIVSGWAGGYLLVSTISWPRLPSLPPLMLTGCSNRRVLVERIRRRGSGHRRL